MSPYRINAVEPTRGIRQGPTQELHAVADSARVAGFSVRLAAEEKAKPEQDVGTHRAGVSCE
jgi:hypothetical protein